MRIKAVLSPASTTLAMVLLAWFGLNFIGVPGLVDAEPLVSLAGVMLALLAILVAGGWRQWRGLAWLASLVLLVWLGLQVETHWWTYLVSEPTEARLGWYQRNWGHLARLLPERAGHTVPDLYHTVLATLLVGALGSSIRDIMRRLPAGRAR